MIMQIENSEKKRIVFDWCKFKGFEFSMRNHLLLNFEKYKKVNFQLHHDVILKTHIK